MLGFLAGHCLPRVATAGRSTACKNTKDMDSRSRPFTAADKPLAELWHAPAVEHLLPFPKGLRLRGMRRCQAFHHFITRVPDQLRTSAQHRHYSIRMVKKRFVYGGVGTATSPAPLQCKLLRQDTAQEDQLTVDGRASGASDSAGHGRMRRRLPQSQSVLSGRYPRNRASPLTRVATSPARWRRSAGPPDHASSTITPRLAWHD